MTPASVVLSQSVILAIELNLKCFHARLPGEGSALSFSSARLIKYPLMSNSVTSVIFALCGAEIATIAAAESREPGRAVERIHQRLRGERSLAVAHGGTQRADREELARDRDSEGSRGVTRDDGPGHGGDSNAMSFPRKRAPPGNITWQNYSIPPVAVLLQ